MRWTFLDRWKFRSALVWAALGLCLALVVVNVLHDRLFHHPLSAAPPNSETAAWPAESGDPTSVTLPEGKWKSARLKTEPARRIALATEVDVAGRIEANADRRVEVRPRIAGVIRTVHVALGQAVKRGDALVTLDSADVGTARLNVRARQRELLTVRTEAEWKGTIARNVADIIPELRKGTTAAVLQKQFADRPLGANRALLIAAYTELELASHEEEKTSAFYKQKILGEHPAFVAMHTREGAQAKFEAAIEQVRYDAAQQQRLADQQVRLAEAAVIDAAQRLRILGVSEDIADLLAHPDSSSNMAAGSEDVTLYRIDAPFDGTIIQKNTITVSSQRVDPNDALLTLADLTTVRVTANIPESDFTVLPALRQGTIRLAAAAYPDRLFEAKILDVGAQVDPNTRTVPLLAETPNPGGILKLGMFMRIVLDSSAKEEALTVPTSAIVEIEGRKGVFVPSGVGGRTFRLHPVKLGREIGDRQIITSGLHKDDPVVSAGAFLLKSELILQTQTEED